MRRADRVRNLLATAERHTRAGRLGRAMFFYRRVIAVTQDGDFERELAHGRLGDLHLGLGQAERALPHLRRAQALSGGEPEYALMLGNALLALGRPHEAAIHLHDALASAHAGEALAALAQATADLGDRQAAGQVARLAARCDPHSTQVRALTRAYADA